MWKPMAAMAAALAFACGSTAALAAFPDRPVKILVGYAPGAAVDLVTRKIAERLQQQTGQPFIIENKPGVGGMVAAAQVANAKADGYTVLAYDNTYVTLPTTTKNLVVDPITAFKPVTVVMYTPGVIVVPANSPFQTLSSLIAYAKAHPGKLNYGAGNIGGSTGLATENFKLTAGIDMQHVSFKGGSEIVVNLMSHQIDMAMLTTPSVAQQIEAGRLRALAVTGAQRLPLFPSVPTTAEAGLPGFTFSNWTGMALPAAAPQSIAATLRALVQQALQSTEMQTYIKQTNARGGGQSPEEFSKQVQEEFRLWTDVAKRAGLAPKP